jgi:hypothetical protein
MKYLVLAATFAAALTTGVANAATIGNYGSAPQQQSEPTYFHGGRSAPADFTDVNRYKAELQNQGLGAQQDNTGINQHAQ